MMIYLLNNLYKPIFRAVFTPIALKIKNGALQNTIRRMEKLKL